MTLLGDKSLLGLSARGHWGLALIRGTHDFIKMGNLDPETHGGKQSEDIGNRRLPRDQRAQSSSQGLLRAAGNTRH